MTKQEKIQLLIDDHGFTEDDLKELTVKELDELLLTPDAPADETQGARTGTGYYPRKNLFGQVIQDVDRTSGNLKVIEKEVDYRIIKFKHGEVRFEKGKEVSTEELALMSDYQKEFYLDAK